MGGGGGGGGFNSRGMEWCVCVLFWVAGENQISGEFSILEEWSGVCVCVCVVWGGRRESD